MLEARLNARLSELSENVYPNVAPQGYSSPCVVYQRLKTQTHNDLDGYDDQTFVTVMLSISSPIYSEALTLARAVKVNLREWEDEEVQSVSWLDETVAVDNTTETTIHRVMLFFKFFCADM